MEVFVSSPATPHNFRGLIHTSTPHTTIVIIIITLEAFATLQSIHASEALFMPQ